MYTIPDSSQPETSNLSHWQLQLFPLDPWGAEHIVAVLDNPHPRLRRVMLGPLIMGGWSYGRPEPLQFIAVSADRMFVTRSWLPAVKLQNESEIWDRIELAMVQARKAAHDTENPPHATAADSFRRWTDPGEWYPRSQMGDAIAPALYSLSKLLTRQALGNTTPFDAERAQFEKQALAMAREQIQEAVLQVLGALDEGVLEMARLRPRIGIGTACRLLELAHLHSPRAVVYARQALKTESYGALKLLAWGEPKEEAYTLRGVLFRGESFPKALEQMGIPKAAHRRSLVPAPQASPGKDDKTHALSEMYLDGREWLFAMKLPLPRPLTNGDGRDFRCVIHLLLSYKFSDPTLYSRVLQHSTRSGWYRCPQNMEGLISQARALSTMANLWAQWDLSLEQALNMRLNNPKERCTSADLVETLSDMTKKSISELIQALLEHHPGIPQGWSPPQRHQVKALNRLEWATQHGKACNNCLENPREVIRYLEGRFALYGVYASRKALGTIALSLDRTESKPKVQVWEVTGRSNAPSNLTLGRIAQSLAQAWDTSEALGKWALYDAKCQQGLTPSPGLG